MSNAQIVSTYYRGQGAVWLAARTSAGQSAALFPIGDADKLEITTKETFDDVRESITGLRTRVVHTAVENDIDFSLDLLNFSGEAVAQAFFGTATPHTSGTASSEVIVGGPGGAAFTKYPNITVTSVKNSSDATTYVLGTDYIVSDAVSGRIDFPSGSAITAGQVLHINYSYAAVGNIVEALTNLGSREVFIVFEGTNMDQQNTPVKVVMYRVYLNLANTFSLLGTASQKMTITGALLPAPEVVSGSKFFTTTIASQNTLFTP